MSEKIKLNGVMIDEHKDPRNYTISMFIPGQDIIEDEEFCLNLPSLNIIINQTRYGACVGHAFATAKSILEYNRTNKWIDFDPFMIYGTRYANEYDGMGMYPYQGAKVLLQDGAFFRRDFNIQQEVPELYDTIKTWKASHAAEVQKAKDYVISGYYFVSTVDGIKRSLKNGMPVSVAYPLYSSFYDVGDDGVVPLKKSTDKIEGFHQMLIVGWTKNKHWIVVNSWGTLNGFKGMYFIPFDYRYDTAIVVSDTITPSKYKAKEISLSVNKSDYIVDGQIKTLDSVPYLKNSRTYVPVRFVTEALGASVEWLPDTQEVIIRSEEAVIKMQIGNNKFEINGRNRYNDTAPELVNSRTMLPIRIVAEALNCKVDWIAETETVIISAL